MSKRRPQKSALENLLGDLRSVAQGIADQAMVERGSRWITQLAAENPIAHQLLMGWLDKDPASILEALTSLFPSLRPHRGNQNLEDYLGRVQEELARMKSDGEHADGKTRARLSR